MHYANPTALALIGKLLQQVLGHTELSFQKIAAAARQILENDRLVMAPSLPQEIGEQVPLPDSTLRVWVSLRSPYWDTQGRMAGLLGISRDITDRKQLELERAQTLEQLQLQGQGGQFVFIACVPTAPEAALSCGGGLCSQAPNAIVAAPSQ